MSDLRLVSNRDALKNYRGYTFRGTYYPDFVLKDFVRSLVKENILLYNQAAEDKHVGLVQQLYGCGPESVVKAYGLGFPPEAWREHLALTFRLPCVDCGKWFSFLPFTIEDYRANAHHRLKHYPNFVGMREHDFKIAEYDFLSDLITDHKADEEFLRDFPFCGHCFWERYHLLSGEHDFALDQRKAYNEAKATKEAAHATACLEVLNQHENIFNCLEDAKPEIIVMLKMVVGATRRFGLWVEGDLDFQPLSTVKDRVEPGEYNFLAKSIQVMVENGFMRATGALPGAFKGVKVTKTHGLPSLEGAESVGQHLTVRYKNVQRLGFAMNGDTIDKYCLDLKLVMAYDKHYRLPKIYDDLDKIIFPALLEFTVGKTQEIGVSFPVSPSNHEAVTYLSQNFGLMQAFSIVVYVLRSVAYDVMRGALTKKAAEQSLGSMFVEYGQGCVRSKIGPMNKKILDRHFTLSQVRPSVRGYLVDVLGYTVEELYTHPRSTNQMRDDVGQYGRVRKGPKTLGHEGDTPLFPEFEG